MPLRESYRILSFDYRGHGQSSKIGPYSFRQLVDDIEAVRIHFSRPSDPVILCGGSFGGRDLHILLKAHSDSERLLGPTVRLDISRKARPSHSARNCTIASSYVLSSCFANPLADSYADEIETVKVLEQRLHKAPSLSMNQLKNKIFGAFESDAEFQLVMHAAAPLYSESFDADVALAATLKTVYSAESHSKLIGSEFCVKMADDSSGTVLRGGEVL